MMVNWFLKDKEDIIRGRGRKREIQAEGIVRTYRWKYNSIQEIKTTMPGVQNVSEERAKM